MAKRFTDTSKWEKQSFHDLPTKMKLVWLYLCDKCDHAGVWDLNIGLMSYQIGSKITLNEILKGLGDKVELRGNKLLVTAFVEFQYGKLNPDNKVHHSVLQRLEKLAPIEPHTSPIQGAKDKDKEKDQDKAKEEDKDPGFDFEFLYDEYPRKLKKGESLKRLSEVLKTRQDYDDFAVANKKHAEYHARTGTKEQFIPHMTTFIENRESKPYTQPWRDWLDPSTGTSTITKNPGDISHLFAGIKDDAS